MPVKSATMPPVTIVGLLSCHREGRLAADAAASLLEACQTVHVLEGPIGEAGEGPETDWRQFRREQRLILHSGVYDSDAGKRTVLLEKTRRYPPPVWAVVVDGDEILLWAKYLPAQIEYAQHTGGHGVKLRLVEADGSVALLGSRVFRADLVERYLASSNQLLFTNGVTAAFPNQKLLAGDEPDSHMMLEGSQRRRPLQGEPFLLHRSSLRDPSRRAQRQHQAEAGEWEKLEQAAGLERITEKVAPALGERIWLPQ